MTKPRSIAEFKARDGRIFPKYLGGERGAVNRAVRRWNKQIVREEVAELEKLRLIDFGGKMQYYYEGGDD